jgi:hypothetical protein
VFYGTIADEHHRALRIVEHFEQVIARPFVTLRELVARRAVPIVSSIPNPVPFKRTRRPFVNAKKTGPSVGPYAPSNIDYQLFESLLLLMPSFVSSVVGDLQEAIKGWRQVPAHRDSRFPTSILRDIFCIPPCNRLMLRRCRGN